MKKNGRSGKKDHKRFSKKSEYKKRSRKAALSRAVKSADKKGAHRPVHDEYVGIFLTTSRGFGFIKCDEFNEDLFVHSSKTLGAQGGDEIRFVTKQDRMGKLEAVVTEITKRNSELVTGVLCDAEVYVRRGGRSIPVRAFDFVPDNTKRINFNVRISAHSANGAESGDRVAVKILEYPTRASFAVGKVVEVFGDTDSPESAVSAVLFSSGIPREFDSDVISEANSLSAYDSDEISRRLDLRDKTVFTIDSEYAKDLDDAISVERFDEGWLLGVHIADVSHYVRSDSAIDREAKRRGTSVYFPGSVIPMLPEALSNNLCSLNAETDKLTLSAMIKLDKSGEILSCEVAESVISSASRAVYKELNSILDKTADKDIKAKYKKPVTDMLKEAVRLYKVLKKRSDKRGCFELESNEAVIVLDDLGYPCDIKRVDRGITERLIEQFMICANEAVARLTHAKGIDGVYRIHEKPDPEKCVILLQYAENLGLEIKGKGFRSDRLGAVQMQKLLELAREKEVGRAVSEVLLRSLMKARYSVSPIGHFGLALGYYSHFTSPIRRYADLTLHRILKDALACGEKLVYTAKDEENAPDARVSDRIIDACEAANDGELRALGAERAIDDIYKAFYMKEHEGEIFDATVISVTTFGFFAMLDNTCEGLVPSSELGRITDYDESHMSLTDEYGRKFTVGMKLKLCLENVDTALGKLTFSLADEDDD